MTRAEFRITFFELIQEVCARRRAGLLVEAEVLEKLRAVKRSMLLEMTDQNYRSPG